MNNSLNELNTIANIKKNHLGQWIEERFDDLRVFSRDYNITKILLSRQMNLPKDHENERIISEKLKSYKDDYRDFDEISITDKSGIIILSTNNDRLGLKIQHNIKTETGIPGGIKYHKVRLSENGKAVFSISKNIYYKRNAEIMDIGEATFFISIEDIINPMLQEREGMGKTGETLLVDEDAISLIELRWKKNSALKYKITGAPGVLASQGKEGLLEVDDYRGVPVVSAYRYIPYMRWGLVVKKDRSEIFQPVNHLIFILLITLFSGLAAFSMFIYYLSRRITGPVGRLNFAAAEIARGKFNIIIDESEQNELGQLAASFNMMNKKLSLLFKNHETMLNISNLIYSTIEFEKLVKISLKEIADFLNCQSAMFFYYNRNSGCLEWKSGIAPPRPGFSEIHPGTGLIGETARSGKITIIQDIPEEAEYMIQVGDREIQAKTAIHVPIIYNEELIGVAVLNSIFSFKEEKIDLLRTISRQLAVALKNSLTYQEVLDQTRKLDASNEELNATNEEMEAINEELIATNEELQSANEEMERQAAELEGNTFDLKEQQKKVKDADRLKSEFLSSMSHELRTPLNSIMAISQGLAQKFTNTGNNADLEYVKIIDRKGHKLLKLINDILDLAKIESGKVDLNINQIRMESLIKAVLNTISPLAMDKGLDLNCSIHDNIPDLYTDSDKLMQIIINIAGNAVKFTEKGSIIVEAWARDDEAYIKISDTGIGIKEEEIKFIFDEFRQLDGSVNRKYGGTGLGLSIVNKLLKLIGGNISVESRFGEGSTFTVTFPISLENRNNDDGVSLEIQPKPYIRKKNITILLIDDNPDNIASLKLLLEEYDFNFIEARTGKIGLELAAEAEPDIILLDIQLPDISGMDLLSELKKSMLTKKIPVITVTAKAMKGDREYLLNKGFDGYVSKPVEKGALIEALNNFLNLQ